MEPDADISGHILTAKGNDELNRKREISINVIRIIKIPRIKLNVFDLLLLTFMPKTQSFHQNKPYPSDSLLTIPFASNNNAREKKDFVMLTAAAIPN